MEELDVFYNRLKKIGIEVTLAMNFPWIYLLTVNGKSVKEKFDSDHGFVLSYLPIRDGKKMRYTDIKMIFLTIRKYL